MSQEYIERVLKTHTLRVEFIDGQVLLYQLAHEDKEEFEKWLRYRVEDDHESISQFCSFFSAGRMVYINIKDVARFIFCYDFYVVQDRNGYHDNFEVIVSDSTDFVEEIKNELFLPQAIIKVRGVAVPYCYWEADFDNNFLFIDERSFSNKKFLKTGFITLPDNDGEQNYIPVRNIVCLELDRRLVITNEDWHQIQLQRNLGRSLN